MDPKSDLLSQTDLEIVSAVWCAREVDRLLLHNFYCIFTELTEFCLYQTSSSRMNQDLTSADSVPNNVKQQYSSEDFSIIVQPLKLF